MTIDAQIRLALQLIPRPPHKPYRYRTRVSDTCAHGIDYPHRVVAEAVLGRPLQAGETVAHMDRDAENISPENLIVFRTRADFARWQRTGIFERCADGAVIAPEISHGLCRVCQAACDNAYCSPNCYQADRSSHIPEPEVLRLLVWSIPTTQIARLYGVSDKAVAKWCLSRKVSKPPRGYWQQHYSHMQRIADDPVGAVIAGLMTRSQMLARLVARRSEIEALINSATHVCDDTANSVHPGGP